MELTKCMISSSIKMTPIGSVAQFSSTPISIFLLSSYVTKKKIKHQSIIKFRVSNVLAESATSTTEKRTSFGFKNVSETFWVDVQRAEGRPLNVTLKEPLDLGTSNLEKVENVGIRIDLSNGCVGWGEVSVHPLLTGNQTETLLKVKEVCQFLSLSQPMTLNLVLDKIDGVLYGSEFSSIRAGIEMALIDAVANSIGVPLWRLFGGVSNSLSTAIMITAVSPLEASRLASKYNKLGFKTLKFHMGKNLDEDIEVLKAVKGIHPHCSFILDANERYASQEAIEVLGKLYDTGITPIHFEQPVHRDDWKGLRDVSNFARDTYGMRIIADESCRSLNDIEKIAKENFANVLNIKLAKFGVLETLQIVKVAKAAGVDLMIDGMIETRLATGFAAHLAAGLGCFKYVNLNTPFLLPEDPVVGGYEVSGAIYKFINARGQGVFFEMGQYFLVHAGNLTLGLANLFEVHQKYI